MPVPPHPPAQPRPSQPPAPRTLAELATSAARGDRPAFEELHARLAPGVRRLLLQRVRGRDDTADDLAQRTWLAAWKALHEGKYDPKKSAITTFVYAVATKMWLQHLRQAGRAHEAAIDAEAIDAWGAADAPDPTAAAHLAGCVETMRACLRGEGEGALTEQERYIVTAAASGVPDRDLAARLGVAPSTLNVRKQAALTKVRRYLAVRGYRDDSADQPQAGRE